MHAKTDIRYPEVAKLHVKWIELLHRSKLLSLFSFVGSIRGRLVTRVGQAPLFLPARLSIENVTLGDKANWVHQLIRQ